MAAPIAERWEFLGDVARAAVVERLRGVETPILEEDADGSWLVTFVWSSADARAVVLAANALFDHAHPGLSEFERLAGSDLWVLSYLVPSGWRAGYVITEHSGDGPAPWRAATDRRAARLAAMAGGPDPRNPLRAAQMMSEGEQSVVEVPDAPEHPFASPPFGPAPEEWSVPDAVAGLDRRVWVYRPPAPASSPLAARVGVAVDGARQDPGPGREGTPLLLLFDGQVWATRASLATMLDRAIRAGALPPLHVAMIDSVDPDRRTAELGVSGGINDFVLDTLLPLLRRELPVSAAPEATAVSGQSFGGLAALWLLGRAPETVGAAIAQSPSLWRNDPSPLLLDRSAPYRLVLTAGCFEEEIAEGAAGLAERLLAGGAKVLYRPVTGGHDWAWWSQGLIAGLQELYGRPPRR
ncbi:enterochelin esterase domain-containing protein [Mycetocola reblochoni]|uniref:Putative esterase n=1 Tax=Mycetocola reblochoni REB411 TaxID=1255698 RepID=A0A1R4JVY7_9MICO|nr:putative esterase [Mycetocola reblochoni REB411]